MGGQGPGRDASLSPPPSPPKGLGAERGGGEPSAEPPPTLNLAGVDRGASEGERAAAAAAAARQASREAEAGRQAERERRRDQRRADGGGWARDATEYHLPEALSARGRGGGGTKKRAAGAEPAPLFKVDRRNAAHNRAAAHTYAAFLGKRRGARQREPDLPENALKAARKQ